MTTSRTPTRIPSRAWTAAIAGLLALTALTCAARADELRFRSFSASAAIGPPADAFAAELASVSGVALGPTGQVRFVRLPGLPAIAPQFGGDIVAAVAAGEAAGGFDAAYISGGDLNKTWGFLFNSGVPLGPAFDEFVGFLYGQTIGAGGPGAGTRESALDVVQEILLAKRGVMAVPIVGSPEQLSGYFLEPMGDVPGRAGIGLAGLCEQHWALRYLPPGENVIGLACDELVREGRIRAKNLTFVEAVPGGGSLVGAVASGAIQGFEFATPLDDLSQLFVPGTDNPGTLGLRFVHVPGWQQQFLLTWMIVNRARWDALSPGQKVILQEVAQARVIASYAENLRQQGPSLATIFAANRGDGRRGDDMVLSTWPERDLARLSAATIRFLNARTSDPSLPAGDRADYARILDALRAYVHDNDRYWDHRQVDPRLRFEGWVDLLGQCWSDPCGDRHAGRR